MVATLDIVTCCAAPTFTKPLLSYLKLVGGEHFECFSNVLVVRIEEKESHPNDLS